jgi:hypothetical protein
VQLYPDRAETRVRSFFDTVRVVEALGLKRLSDNSVLENKHRYNNLV